MSELLAEFRSKSEPLGVVVLRAATPEDAALLVLESDLVANANTLLVADELAERSPRFARALEAGGARVEPPGPPGAVRDAPVGLSLAHLAVAETGSTLLSESSLSDRTVGMLTLAHIIVVPMDALAASLDDAAPVLRRLALAGTSAMTTLVTGPSRTADIERVLTVGVQGPGRVMVIFVEDL